MSKQRVVIKEYKEFVTTAEYLADKESPERHSPQWEERLTYHIMNLTRLYDIRYGRVKGRSDRRGSGPLFLLIMVVLVVGAVIGYFLSVALGGIFW